MAKLSPDRACHPVQRRQTPTAHTVCVSRAHTEEFRCVQPRRSTKGRPFCLSYSPAKVTLQDTGSECIVGGAYLHMTSSHHSRPSHPGLISLSGAHRYTHVHSHACAQALVTHLPSSCLSHVDPVACLSVSQQVMNSDCLGPSFSHASL